MNKAKFKKDELSKPVTLGLLLEFTDEFLIPRLSDVIDNAFERQFDEMFDKKFEEKFDKKLDDRTASQTYELKKYIDLKFDQYTTDTFKRLDKKYGQEKQFKEKVVQLFKKHNIGSPTDLAFLEGLVSGS